MVNSKLGLEDEVKKDASRQVFVMVGASGSSESGGQRGEKLSHFGRPNGQV